MRSIIQQRLADAVSMDIPALVEREYRLPEIPNKAYAIIGMRRVGKAYFLYQTFYQECRTAFHSKQVL